MLWIRPFCRFACRFFDRCPRLRLPHFGRSAESLLCFMDCGHEYPKLSSSLSRQILQVSNWASLGWLSPCCEYCTQLEAVFYRSPATRHRSYKVNLKCDSLQHFYPRCHLVCLNLQNLQMILPNEGRNRDFASAWCTLGFQGSIMHHACQSRACT